MNPDEQNPSIHNGVVLKELSDIKASLAVNTNETANIKASIGEIKTDIKDIKSDSVGRREFSEALVSVDVLKKDLSFIQKVVWGGLGIIAFIQIYLTYFKK